MSGLQSIDPDTAVRLSTRHTLPDKQLKIRVPVHELPLVVPPQRCSWAFNCTSTTSPRCHFPPIAILCNTRYFHRSRMDSRLHLFFHPQFPTTYLPYTYVVLLALDHNLCRNRFPPFGPTLDGNAPLFWHPRSNISLPIPCEEVRYNALHSCKCAVHLEEDAEGFRPHGAFHREAGGVVPWADEVLPRRGEPHRFSHALTGQPRRLDGQTHVARRRHRHKRVQLRLRRHGPQGKGEK